MLSDTVAATTMCFQSSHYRVPIILAWTTFQGLPILVPIFMYSKHTSRLMSNGLLAPDATPNS